MKIAIYSGEIPSTVFIENLIAGLAKNGHEVYIFGRLKKKYNPPKNVKVYGIPRGKIGKLLYGLFWFFRFYFLKTTSVYKLMKLVGKHGFFRSYNRFLKLAPIFYFDLDVFHIQWAKTIQQFPELFELPSAKMIVSFRGAHINYSPLLDKALANSYRSFFPKVDGFHAVSEDIKKEASKYGDIESKTEVIFPAIHDDLLNNSTKKFTEFNNPLNVLSVGRFHWKKAYHYAIEAVKILKDQGVQVKYTIVAEGIIPEEILFIIHDLQLSKEIQILPGMPHAKILETMRNADVFLLPSVEEGIANVVLEAMAIGVPVISTDCGGLSEVIINKQNGYLVPVRDPNAIAVAINEVMNLSANDFENLTSNARIRIQNNHVLSLQVSQMEALYHKVLQS